MAVVIMFKSCQSVSIIFYIFLLPSNLDGNFFKSCDLDTKIRTFDSVKRKHKKEIKYYYSCIILSPDILQSKVIPKSTGWKRTIRIFKWIRNRYHCCLCFRLVQICLRVIKTQYHLMK